MFSGAGQRTRQEWFSGRHASVFLPDGRRVRLTGIEHNYMTFLLHWQGWTVYEPFTLLLLMELIADEQSFLHVGANIGYFPLVAALYQPGLKIAGFEPNPRVCATFRDNVEVNGADVAVETMAVAEVEGSLEFFLSPSDMSGSLDPRFQRTHAGAVHVPVVTLDGYLQTHPMPPARLVRIIVEGFEHQVLRGAPGLMDDPGAEFIIAVVRDASPEMTALLRGSGFSFYNISDRGLEPADAIRFIRRGDFNYLDWFVTRRPPAEVAAISSRMMPLVRRIDLKKTSMHRPEWEATRPYA